MRTRRQKTTKTNIEVEKTPIEKVTDVAVNEIITRINTKEDVTSNLIDVFSVNNERILEISEYIANNVDSRVAYTIPIVIFKALDKLNLDNASVLLYEIVKRVTEANPDSQYCRDWEKVQSIKLQEPKTEGRIIRTAKGHIEKKLYSFGEFNSLYDEGVTVLVVSSYNKRSRNYIKIGNLEPGEELIFESIKIVYDKEEGNVDIYAI